MALLSYAFSLSDDSINAGVIFLQSGGFDDGLSGIQWRFSLGLSLGIGGLNEVSQRKRDIMISYPPRLYEDSRRRNFRFLKAITSRHSTRRLTRIN